MDDLDRAQMRALYKSSAVARKFFDAYVLEPDNPIWTDVDLSARYLRVNSITLLAVFELATMCGFNVRESTHMN